MIQNFRTITFSLRLSTSTRRRTSGYELLSRSELSFHIECSEPIRRMSSVLILFVCPTEHSGMFETSPLEVHHFLRHNLCQCGNTSKDCGLCHHLGSLLFSLSKRSNNGYSIAFFCEVTRESRDKMECVSDSLIVRFESMWNFVLFFRISDVNHDKRSTHRKTVVY